MSNQVSNQVSGIKDVFHFEVMRMEPRENTFLSMELACQKVVPDFSSPQFS